jgi:uncharacterized protein (DUF4415 family)
MSITNERLAEIKAFKNMDFSDCPPLTEEQMKGFRPSHLRNKANRKVAKVPVSARVDADIVGWLRNSGITQSSRLEGLAVLP